MKGKIVFLLGLALVLISPLRAQYFQAGEHVLGISRLGISGSLGDPLTGGNFFRPVAVLRYGYHLQDNFSLGSDVGGDLALVNNGQTGATLVWTGIFRPYLRQQLGQDELSFFVEGGAGILYRFWNIPGISPWVYQLQAVAGLTYRPSQVFSLDLGLGYSFRYEVTPGFWFNNTIPRIGANLHF